MLKIPWTEYVSNNEVLRKNGNKNDTYASNRKEAVGISNTQNVER